jgi:ribonuclease P protein component
VAASAAGAAGLPRGERLRDRTEIGRVFRRGGRIERPSFVLLWLPVAGRRAAAFATSRRLGGSVVRNRARRRLREAYRQHKALVPPEGIRLCFVARPRAVAADFAQVSQEVAGALGDAARRLGA